MAEHVRVCPGGLDAGGLGEVAQAAVRIYNDLTEGTLVAGLFHSTC